MPSLPMAIPIDPLKTLNCSCRSFTHFFCPFWTVAASPKLRSTVCIRFSSPWSPSSAENSWAQLRRNPAMASSKPCWAEAMCSKALLCSLRVRWISVNLDSWRVHQNSASPRVNPLQKKWLYNKPLLVVGAHWNSATAKCEKVNPPRIVGSWALIDGCLVVWWSITVGRGTPFWGAVGFPWWGWVGWWLTLGAGQKLGACNEQIFFCQGFAEDLPYIMSLFSRKAAVS